MAEGIKKDIADLKEQIELLTQGEKKKPREFKLPTMAKLNRRRVRDNWVTIIKINENGSLAFKKEPIIDQTVEIDGVPRLVTAEYVLNYKNKPIIIQPSWSVLPYSPSEQYRKSLSDGSNTVGYRILLERMKAGAIGLKKKIGAGMVIGVLVGLVVVGYLLFGGG